MHFMVSCWKCLGASCLIIARWFLWECPALNIQAVNAATLGVGFKSKQHNGIIFRNKPCAAGYPHRGLFTAWTEHNSLSGKCLYTRLSLQLSPACLTSLEKPSGMRGTQRKVNVWLVCGCVCACVWCVS